MRDTAHEGLGLPRELAVSSRLVLGDAGRYPTRDGTETVPT